MEKSEQVHLSGAVQLQLAELEGKQEVMMMSVIYLQDYSVRGTLQDTRDLKANRAEAEKRPITKKG